MTVREKLEDLLVAHGLWPEEAKTVMDVVVASPKSEPMKERWGDKADGYPEGLFGILLVSAKKEAIKYLKENKPQHFALMILEG